MRVLIIDDEKYIRESIQRLLSFENISSDCSASGEDAQNLLLENFYNAIILDLKLPGMSGQEFLIWMNDEGIRTPVIMISGHGEINDAVLALKAGAKDYLVKPFDSVELILKLKKIIAAQKMENLIELGRRTSSKDTELVGNSPSMQSIQKLIIKIAPIRSTVLITGESGTGKEIVARAIHDSSPDRDEPFVAVNMAGIPDTLIESELFGHEKGAFTGADKRKPGLFELAGRGTLFLDEIGEMPVPLQVKLLRILQERKVRRLGGIRDIPVDARIISATNKNIELLVKSGGFREDLFYRLNVVRIHTPPLRERTDDIPILAGFLLEKLSERIGISRISLSQSALEKLKTYQFPGNVRELENILERALIYNKGEEITEHDIDLKIDLPHKTFEHPIARTSKQAKQPDIDPTYSGGMLKKNERETIVNTLKKWKGNRTRAAEELGISRRTIINKIKRYNITE